MVDPTEGQFYTMEGIAAAILMVLTAYLVLGGTSLYTSGDTHIIDMQLEQLGNDALKAMDTINDAGGEYSELEYLIRKWDGPTFTTNFSRYLNDPTIYFKATVYYRKTNAPQPLNDTLIESRPYLPGENAITVSRWVFIPVSKTGDMVLNSHFDSNKTVSNGGRNETVLMEVLLWRG